MTTPPLDPAHAHLTSGYGLRFEGTDLHTGIDLAAARGEPVRAVRSGRVLVSAPPGQLNKYGNVIVIEHATGEATLYAHLDARYVNRGQLVSEGQIIGAVGDTAGTRADPSRRFGESGTHLHFELLRHWPPPGIDQGRIDPTRLWPPAVEGREGRRTPPQLPQQPPAAPRTTGGLGAGVIVALVLYALSRR